MADNNKILSNDGDIFLVTFDIKNDDADDFLKNQILNCFDGDFLPQCFKDLDDAKNFIQDIATDVVCDVPGSLKIHPDFIPWDGKGDPDNHFFDFVHGDGLSGADRPWLSVDDCGGASVDFFIHQVHLH